MAAIAEHFRDEAGLVWPVSVAPFHVHLITLGSDQKAIQRAEELYAELEASGIETLFDDREESAGVKFNDADLIGIPFRVTVSPRSLQAGGAEIKRRDLPRDTTVTLPVSEVYNYIFGQLAEMQQSLLDKAQQEEARTPEATTV
jgi:prolyl-tRNA synthetase